MVKKIKYDRINRNHHNESTSYRNYVVYSLLIYILLKRVKISYNIVVYDDINIKIIYDNDERLYE